MKKPLLGFGCSPLLGRVGKAESLRALAAAYESGITFYDTARSYGYGEGERLLGDFFKQNRHRITISTKFGIVAEPQGLLKRVAKPVVRHVLKIAPSFRGLVRSRVQAQFRAPGFTTALLQESLEESLRQLKTDYIDILFMHEAPPEALRNSELLDALGKLMTEGKLRMAGVSSTPDILASSLERPTGVLSAMQFACNVFDLSMTSKTFAAAERGIFFVANHPFGGVSRVAKTRQRLHKIKVQPDTPLGIRQKLEDVGDQVLSDVVLNVITRSTGIQVVVPSMMTAEHLRSNITALKDSRFCDAEISWLRSRFAQSSTQSDIGLDG
jgi:aryl-alcohol dehydrogenase-like predicted oxidoreductase